MTKKSFFETTTYSWMPPASSPTWGGSAPATQPCLREWTIRTASINTPGQALLLLLLTVAHQRVKTSEIIPIEPMTQAGSLLFIKSWFSQHRRKQSENISPFIIPDNRHPRLLLLFHTRHFPSLALESSSTPSHTGSPSQTLYGWTSSPNLYQ